MKKIRLLQIMVYVVFSLLVIQNIGSAIYKGFIQSFNDVSYNADGDRVQKELVLPDVVLGGSPLVKSYKGNLKTGGNYTLTNISVQTDIRLDKAAANRTWQGFDPIKFLLIIGSATILYIIAKTINQVIKRIYDDTMFEAGCISLIRKTATCIIIYAVLDFTYQCVTYFEKMMLVGGQLQVVNDIEFSLESVLLAVFLYIIAEAFKQGAQLKEQQELTI